MREIDRAEAPWSKLARMESRNRSTAIDCLRAFSILWVVAYHFVPLDIFRYGTYGVLLFFIISGYCISFSAETSQSAWHFYAKRLGRLLPALLVCGFMTTAFKYFAPQLTEPSRLLSWGTYAYSMFALPTLSFLRIDTRFPDGAYWSLLIEFQFYLICFAIMAIGLRKHLLPVLCIFVAFRTLTTSPDQTSSNDFFPFFIAGLSVAAMVEGRLREALIGIGAAILVDLYHLHFHYLQPSVPVSVSRSVLLWVGTAAMYFAATYKPTRQAERLLLPLSFVGLISYPLYLIHQDVGNMILRWGNVEYTANGTALYVRAFGVTGLMAFLAWIIYFFVERNAIKPLTTFLSRLFQRKGEGADVLAHEAESAIKN
jgi:peptidoglycan/LPS O-acetylase OafA/YrhL